MIRVFFDHHNPPHLHAIYSGHEAVLDIRTLVAISEELLAFWEQARNLGPLGKIDPLP